MSEAIATATLPKPKLRGVLHAISAPLTLIAGIPLLRSAQHEGALGPDQVDEAVALIRAAKKPMIVAGGGVHYSLAEAEALSAALGAGDDSVQIVDPATGVSLRLMLTREYYQTTARVSALWGWKVVRGEHIVRVCG